MKPWVGLQVLPKAFLFGPYAMILYDAIGSGRQGMFIMNPIDYSKSLQREREIFRDTIQKDRQSNEKRIADAEARHQVQKEKQSQAFIQDKTELEKNYQSNLENMDQKTQDAIQDKNMRYQKQLAQEREAFQEESSTKSKDFDQRLNEIKSSYRRSFDSERDNHEHIQDTDKKRYNRNVEEITKNTDQKLREYQDKVVGTGATLKDQYNRERRQLSNSHEDHVRNIYKDQSNKQIALKERVASDIAKNREVSESDMKHLREYSDQRIQAAQVRSNNRIKALATDYSQRNENLTETQRKNAIQTNKEHQSAMAEARRGFQAELRSRDLKDRRNDNGSGDFSETMKNQMGLNERVVAENKLKKLNDQIREIKADVNERIGDNQEAFNEDLRLESSVATARLERKVNELNADKISTVAKERQQKVKEIDNRENQNRISAVTYERQLMLERNSANERIKKLKESFNESFRALEEKSQKNVQAISKISSTDKADFMKQMQEGRNNEIFEMKREFSRLMDQTVTDYEKRLNKYQKDFESMKNGMDLKIQNVMDQSSKEVESQRKLFDDRRKADLRAHQLLQDQKDNSFKQTIDGMNVNFEKKLNLMVSNYEAKLKLITNEYENKLKVLVVSRSKDLNEKDMAHQAELERTKMAYEEEKNRVINQYESQLVAIKTANKEQIESMKEYKRLS